MMSPTDILNLAMSENDAGARTIREYLKALLKEVWQEGESFSGKRPFGNSGWEWDLYKALVLGEAVKGEISDEGELVSFDNKAVNTAIFNAIDELR